jgi:hypothetical protein
MFVRAVVIDYQVKSDSRWHLTVQLFEEREPLHVRVFGRDVAGDLAVQVVEGREQGDGAMPYVVVRSRADVACFQG